MAIAPSSSLLTSLAGLLDDRAAKTRDADRLRDTKAAIASLERRNATASDDRKAAARDKVAQIKARLRTLQMSMSSNPKALAALARELKAAVKAYAAAGGSMSDIGGATAPSGETAAQGPGEGAVQDQGNEAAITDAASDKDTTSDPVESDDQTGDGRPDGDKTSTSDPYRRMGEEAQARAAEHARRDGEKQADREFLNEARSIANLIKSLAKKAAMEAAPSDRQEADQAQTDAAAATAEAANAAGALDAGGISVVV